MARAIRPDQLAQAVEDAMRDYASRVHENVIDATRKATKVALAEVRHNAAEHWGETNVGRKYVNGWTSKVDTGKTSAQGVVYNRLIPGLPHLLEFGHAKRGGDRKPVEGIPHIMPVVEWIEQEAEKWMIDAIEGG